MKKHGVSFQDSTVLNCKIKSGIAPPLILRNRGTSINLVLLTPSTINVRLGRDSEKVCRSYHYLLLGSMPQQVNIARFLLSSGFYQGSLLTTAATEACFQYARCIRMAFTRRNCRCSKIYLIISWQLLFQVLDLFLGICEEILGTSLRMHGLRCSALPAQIGVKCAFVKDYHEKFTVTSPLHGIKTVTPRNIL